MINILAVSDEETREYNDHLPYSLPNKEADILLCCGDLSPNYLEFVINKYNPKYSIKVTGNHDQNYYEQGYDDNQYSQIFKGFYVLNDSILEKQGIKIAGFSGAPAEGREWPFFYSASDINKFKRNLSWKNPFSSDIDIIISHNAPQIGNLVEEIDAFHAPSEELGEVYKKYFPAVWLYGHIHRRYGVDKLNFKLKTPEGETSYLLNTIPYAFFSYNPSRKDIYNIELPPQRKIYPENVSR
jgi:Icc-related predicted phosphoesterase